MAAYYNSNVNPSSHSGVPTSGRQWSILSPCNGTREISTPCATAWNSSAIYISGTSVSYNSRNYECNYYSLASNPALGYVISGNTSKPWRYTGPCY
ncbi:unnamed protein product [Didymodactylos carnosus]|uniref:Chitin-binding type-3 domain-containing protein n=1 Tax=Didymodactylos carnosus TaxID=1234261 RepID=A0A814MAM2_9BILA|nr:unnamed protein product [Didymodactylos carnosus]CAF3843175.1 unnamed protein product [Didymodactylos carnosus]